VEEGLKEPSTLCSIETVIKECGSTSPIPTPSDVCAKLPEIACVSLPKTFSHLEVEVAIRKNIKS